MADSPKDPATDNDSNSGVKVVDRRWWVNRDGNAGTAPDERGAASLKPTYIEELERQLAEKDRQIQEYLG